MSEAQLQNRDYCVILARSRAKRFNAPPGLEKEWKTAEKSIITLAKQCEQLAPDGITIHIASTPCQTYQNATSQTLAELFDEQTYLTDTLNLTEALKMALDSYFERKAKGQIKANGEIILIFLDGEPKDRRSVIKSLVEATKQIDKNEELGIKFAQVGDDMITKGFLTALDDDLHRAGAKFDIVDTVAFGAMEDGEISQFLLNAIYD